MHLLKHCMAAEKESRVRQAYPLPLLTLTVIA